MNVVFIESFTNSLSNQDQSLVLAVHDRCIGYGPSEVEILYSSETAVEHGILSNSETQ